MNIFTALFLLVPRMTFGDGYPAYPQSPATYSLCDCYDFALAYGYPQTQQYGYVPEICYKFEIHPNPSYQYQCQYPLEYFVLDAYVTYTFMYHLATSLNHN